MTMILILVGIILLLVIHFLYKNTKKVITSYSRREGYIKKYEDIRIKRIFKILLVVISLFPVLNIIVFCILFIIWFIDIVWEDYTFRPNSKFLSKIINYLNEEV